MRLGLGKMTLLALILGVAVYASSSMAAERPRLRFGVVPQLAPVQMAKAWIPFLTYVSRKAGVDLVFVTAKDIPTFEVCLANGVYDLAFMNPYHYVAFHDMVGYEAFAHRKGKRLRGLLVTRKDSKVEGLSGLLDANIAFPSPAAFGASLLIRAELDFRYIPFTPSYVKSHDSVYRGVAAGLFPAGGGVIGSFRKEPEEIRNQLRVIYQTNAYTPHAFAAHPRVDKDVVAAVAQAMVDAGKEVPAMLDAISMPQGIERADDAAWNDVRELYLSPADAGLKAGGSSCLSD